MYRIEVIILQERTFKNLPSTNTALKSISNIPSVPHQLLTPTRTRINGPCFNMAAYWLLRYQSQTPCSHKISMGIVTVGDHGRSWRLKLRGISLKVEALVAKYVQIFDRST